MWTNLLDKKIDRLALLCPSLFCIMTHDTFSKLGWFGCWWITQLNYRTQYKKKHSGKGVSEKEGEREREMKTVIIFRKHWNVPVYFHMIQFIWSEPHVCQWNEQWWSHTRQLKKYIDKKMYRIKSALEILHFFTCTKCLPKTGTSLSPIYFHAHFHVFCA